MIEGTNERSDGRRWWRRPSLRGALVVAVVVPLVGALGAASWIGLRALERQVERSLQGELELVARAIRLPLSRAVEQEDATEVRDALEAVFEINRVYSAYVYDERGEPITSVGQMDPTPPDRSRLTELAEQDIRTGRYDRIGGREVYAYFLPLRGSGYRSLGLLQITRRRSEIEDTMARVRRQALALLVIGALVMTGLVLYGHRSAVGRHLDRLARTMRRVESGDREARAAGDGPREISSVASTLNGMLDSMAEAEREIETRRSTQQALEERLRRARRLAAVGRLAAGVAHELGTPLSVVDGNAQRLARREDVAERAGPALESMRGAIRRMERIVRQLLEFGRRGGLQRTTATAAELARTAVAAVRDEASRSDVELSVSVPEPSPALDADRLRLEEALVHLLRNAVQATAGHGGGGRVEVSWFATADQVGLRVDDDGPGIPKEALPRLFDPFFTTKPVGEGTGLGLAVVHGVVDAHGGRVDVDVSEPLGGACFRIVFPREAVEPETDAAEREDVAADAASAAEADEAAVTSSAKTTTAEEEVDGAERA